MNLSIAKVGMGTGGGGIRRECEEEARWSTRWLAAETGSEESVWART